MKSEQLILTKNFDEIQEAKKLGIKLPEEQKMHTRILFWKRDIRKVLISSEGTLVIEFNNDDVHELEYSENMWKELERFFRDNDDE